MSRAGGYVYNITCAIKMRNNNAAPGLLAWELGAGRPAGFRGPRRRIASSESHLIFSGRASRNDAYRQPGARPSVRPSARPTAEPVHRHVRPHRAKCRPKLATDRPRRGRRPASGSQMSRPRPAFIRQRFHQNIPANNMARGAGGRSGGRLAPVYRASTLAEVATLKQRASCLSVQNDSDSVSPKHQQ